MIFVDTSAWYAYFVRSDGRHSEARQWCDRNREELITTDYIIDEVLTAMRSRGGRAIVTKIGQLLWDGQYAQLEYVRPEDIARAWDVFRRYDDKLWSFTDCTSRVVMERLGITAAFAFDDHFRQFGTVSVVP